MLKLNQITYLFSEWAPEFQPKVALLLGLSTETHKTQDLGLMYEAVEDGYDDYNVITIDAEYEEIKILIMKP
jgi:hypothetical protein